MGLLSLLQLGLLHISSSFFKHFIYLFIFCYAVFVAACGLSLVGASKGYSLVAVHRLLIAVASLVLEQSLMPLGRTTLTAQYPTVWQRAPVSVSPTQLSGAKPASYWSASMRQRAQ